MSRSSSSLKKVSTCKVQVCIKHTLKKYVLNKIIFRDDHTPFCPVPPQVNKKKLGWAGLATND